MYIKVRFNNETYCMAKRGPPDCNKHTYIHMYLYLISISSKVNIIYVHIYILYYKFVCLFQRFNNANDYFKPDTKTIVERARQQDTLRPIFKGPNNRLCTKSTATYCFLVVTHTSTVNYRKCNLL